MYRKTDHRTVELTEVGPRFELKRKFGAFRHVWWRGQCWRVGDDVPVPCPSPSVHDPPGHAGAGGHSGRGVALAPLHQHCAQEGVSERRMSPLRRDPDLDTAGQNKASASRLCAAVGVRGRDGGPGGSSVGT